MNKKLAFAAAIASSWALPMSANAELIALSELTVENLVFIGSADSEVLDVSDFNIVPGTDGALQFQDTGTNTAIYDTNPVLPGYDEATNNLGGIDPEHTCAGPDCGTALAGTYGDNDFATYFLPQFNLARSDSELSGSPLTDTGGLLGSVIALTDGATAEAISATEIDSGNHSGAAGSDLQLSSVFTFQLDQDQEITFEFDASVFLTAYFSDDGAFGSNAFASSTWLLSLSIQGENDPIWTFDTSGEACNLNGEVETFAGGEANRQTYSCTGSYSATTGLLDADTIYEFSINHDVNSNGRITEVRQVPTPAPLALVGIGLMAMGFVRRKA